MFLTPLRDNFIWDTNNTTRPLNPHNCENPGHETQDLNIDVMTACSSHDLSQLYTNACSKVLL